MTDRLHLTESERTHPLWQKLDAHLRAKLAACRAKVENPRVSDAERLALCWRIHEIKDFLAAGETPTSKREMDAG